MKVADSSSMLSSFSDVPIRYVDLAASCPLFFATHLYLLSFMAQRGYLRYDAKWKTSQKQ